MLELLTLFSGGLLLGLAGSVHCACMCGAIASGGLFILDPPTPRQKVISLLLMQAGRISLYALAGGLVASVTSIAIDPALTANSYRVLQWLGAIVLMWTGLATAGMLPRLSLPEGMGPSGRFGSGFATWGYRIEAPLRAHRGLHAYLLGMSWGLTPCPLVYAALFSAMLMGSFAGGLTWMLGFGAGTLPGVLGAVFGISLLPHIGKSKNAEVLAGLTMTALGFSSVYFNWLPAGLICTTP